MHGRHSPACLSPVRISVNNAGCKKAGCVSDNSLHSAVLIRRKRNTAAALLRLVLISAAVIVASSALLLAYLILSQRAAFHRRTACVGNLVRIDLAKEAVGEVLKLTNGSIVMLSDLQQIARQPREVCPNGGVYLINPVGTDPECTYTNVCYTWRLNREAKRVERRHWKHSL